MLDIIQSFVDGFRQSDDQTEGNSESQSRQETSWLESKTSDDYARDAKTMRENQTEQEIDKTLKDSFPASDPPAWY